MCTSKRRRTCSILQRITAMQPLGHSCIAVHGLCLFALLHWCVSVAVTISQLIHCIMIGKCVQRGTDVRELMIYGAYGSLVSNVGHLWYRHLNVLTNRTFRLGTYPAIGAKLCADVFFFNPIHVTCLLSWCHILKGNNIKVRC